MIDATGHPTLAARWHNGNSGSSPNVANGMVFVARSPRVAALDPTTGTTLWSDSRIGAIHWEGPIVANGILYITDESGMLTAYAPGGVAP